MEPYADCWALPFGAKKKCYGKFRVAVGGRTPGLGGASSEEDGDWAAEDQGDEFDLSDVPPVVNGSKDILKRGDDNVEPFCYNSKPVKLYSELLHSFCLKALYDLSPGDGKAAEACLEARKSYVGICLTDEHKAALYNRLIDRVVEAFGKEDSNLFNPAVRKRPADPLQLEATPQAKKSTKLAAEQTPTDEKTAAAKPKGKAKSGRKKAEIKADKEDADDASDTDSGEGG